LATLTPLPSIRRNYFFGGIQAVVGAAFPLAMLAYSARVLGPESLGKYYFANSLAAYFLFAACLGIPVHGVREVGKARGNPERLREVFRELFTINLISSGIAWLVYGAVVLLVPQFRAEAMLFGIIGLLLLNNGLNLDYLFAGMERQDFLAYRSVISKVLSLGLLILFVREPDDYRALALIAVCAAVFNSILSLKGLRYLKGPVIAGGLQLKRHLKPLFLLTFSGLLINIYVQLDSVLLGLFSSAHEVGLYNTAIRPSRVVAVLTVSLMASLVPRLAYLLVNDNRLAHGELQKKSFEFIALITIPIAFTLFASASYVIDFVFGADFAEASVALMLAAPLLLINTLTAFQGFQILIPNHKEGSMVFSAATAAAVGVSLNLVLIPKIGHVGAVIAAVLAEFSCLIVQFFLIRRIGPGHFVYSRESVKYLAAGGIMATIQWVCLRSFVSPAASVFVWIVSAIAYFGILALMRDRIVVGILKALARGAFSKRRG
jgi:O-antigen/teichoic acid export membrane protein